MAASSDPFALDRFIAAQDRVFEHVLEELRAGRKASHWMWFVFPQLTGLGHSATASRYALHGAEEASAYLRHPLLGARLRQCVRLVLAIPNRRIGEIFGSPDELKFRSCMTLFNAVAPDETLYREALERYFDGRGDARTLALLQEPEC